MTFLKDEVARRRTFAIISHPDAGKTTLTEKLLLFGGAIQLAGAVKARGERRRARSDWMKVEQERGISVTASVMSFGYAGCAFNLLDTPGHEDFSEDTYRVLTAVDSAVMVIDAARGIEAQTRKLFEVCRLRDMPVATFINKMDRDGRDPFELIDEVEQTLQIEIAPASWPIGMGRDFLGCYDLVRDCLVLMARSRGETIGEGDQIILFYPSANRDEAVFDDPFKFDLERDPNHHLAFGWGTHFCLGSSLARLELKVMFQRLAERMPDIQLANEDLLPFRASNFIVGPEGMPVTFSPSATLSG